MDVIGIIRNTDKYDSGDVAARIEEILSAKGGRCHIVSDGSLLPPDCECALVLGGDGTLLRAAKSVLDRKLPLLGVNLGDLGYLAEVDVPSLENALQKLMAGEYTVEKRMMLKGKVVTKEGISAGDVALNEISLNRVRPLRTFTFVVSVNDEYLCTYQSDGVIVSTATGSTGYSLSAGGPIVSPGAELSVLTPIAPHSLISRSIILPGSDRITVSIGEGRTGMEPEVAHVRFDGNSGIPLGTGDRVEISKAAHHTRIISINRVSFLDVLRRKMKDS